MKSWLPSATPTPPSTAPWTAICGTGWWILPSITGWTRRCRGKRKRCCHTGSIPCWRGTGSTRRRSFSTPFAGCPPTTWKNRNFIRRTRRIPGRCCAAYLPILRRTMKKAAKTACASVCSARPTRCPIRCFPPRWCRWTGTGRTGTMRSSRGTAIPAATAPGTVPGWTAAPPKTASWGNWCGTWTRSCGSATASTRP